MSKSNWLEEAKKSRKILYAEMKDVINKNTQTRIDILFEALMDISSMDKGHECKCECANNCRERAYSGINEEHSLRRDSSKKESCFSFHLADMDRLFQGMTRWNWGSKKHLTQEWKELAASIRVSMNFSPYYGNGDILHRWFGYWLKHKQMQSRPILDGNNLIEVRDEGE